MKTVNKMHTALRVLAVALVLAISACNPFGDDEPGGGGGGKPPVQNDCSLTGTMVRVICGVSIYDNLWIRTDNGKLIQPCEQSFQTFVALNFKEGDRVKFSYRKINGPSPCDEMIRCLAATPEHTPAIIDCIRVTDPIGGNCGTLLVRQAPEGGYVSVLNAAVSGNMLKLKIGYSGCSPMGDEEFELSWNGALAKSIPARAQLEISSKHIEMCQAYFTKDLCFDISAIKHAANQPVQITIQDHVLIF
jgi:hypothetical protein